MRNTITTGGLDILILGIAGENLDNIASDERLRELFNIEKSADKYYRDFHALINNSLTKNPKIFYLLGEHILGTQIGVGLGYVIFNGNNNSKPKKLDYKLFERISELREMFTKELANKGLIVSEDNVGIYALNVYDT